MSDTARSPRRRPAGAAGTPPVHRPRRRRGRRGGPTPQRRLGGLRARAGVRPRRPVDGAAWGPAPHRSADRLRRNGIAGTTGSTRGPGTGERAQHRGGVHGGGRRGHLPLGQDRHRRGPGAPPTGESSSTTRRSTSVPVPTAGPTTRSVAGELGDLRDRAALRGGVHRLLDPLRGGSARGSRCGRGGARGRRRSGPHEIHRSFPGHPRPGGADSVDGERGGARGAHRCRARRRPARSCGAGDHPPRGRPGRAVDVAGRGVRLDGAAGPGRGRGTAHRPRRSAPAARPVRPTAPPTATVRTSGEGSSSGWPSRAWTVSSATSPA